MTTTPMSTHTEHDSQVKTKFHAWSSIHPSKMPILPAAYVHPLMLGTYPSSTSTVLNQRSLDICTETLGSETGSDGYSDVDHCFHDGDGVLVLQDDGGEVMERNNYYENTKKKELSPVVNYHCSIGRISKVRSFPPPLPSISRRDGLCINLKPHRRDGRLVIEAVRVPSQNYLHCHRQNGRLLLSFIDTTFKEIYPEFQVNPSPQMLPSLNEQEEEEEVDEDEDDEEEGEEKVEVVVRGIVVEVKVSRQPQLQRRGMKVHKSSLVINKFVSGIPVDHSKVEEGKEPGHGTNSSNINTAVAAVMDAKEGIDEVYGWGRRQDEEKSNGQQLQNSSSNKKKKLLFTTTKLMNRQALLHQVRSCRYHHRPLFIWERCCIATS